MKFFNKTNLNRLLVFLGLLFLYAYFPVKALALSGEASEHFSTTCPGTTWSLGAGPNWVASSTNGNYVLVNGNGNATNDTHDTCNPGNPGTTYSVFYCSGTPSGSDSITITYTDPTPSAPTTYIKFDLYDSSSGNNSFSIIVTDVNGHTASSISDDIMPNCYTSSPVTTGNSSPGWQTGYVQVLGAGAVTTGVIGNIKTVQIVFTGNSQMISPGLGGSPIFLDNIRGESILSCFTPTPTGSATPTVTNTPTNTPTSTITNSPTFTPTNTPGGLTATFTNTPTVTLTPTVTNTPTVTISPTPGPAQVEVYPNPIDFTSTGATINGTCPTGKCMVFSGLPLSASLKIYTISLSLVRTFPQGSVTAAGNIQSGYGYIAWDGTNGNAAAVASGLYFYVVNASGTNTFGKFAISKSTTGP
jgi:hypothetical protein